MKGFFSLEDRVALVTGGGKGLGRMITEGLLNGGCARVYIAGVEPELVQATAAELGPRCIPMCHDLSTVAGCRDLGDALTAGLQSAGLSLDILVNNAGVATEIPFEDFEEEHWNIVMDVNVRAPFFVSKYLRPLMRRDDSAASKAKIINIVSIDAIRLNPLPTYSYFASKAGLLWLTRRMAAEFLADNIVCNAISPGSFPTDMNELARDFGTRVAERNPSRRIGRPEDIQAAVTYLASPASDWVVGDNLVLDGGLALAALPPRTVEPDAVAS